MEPAAQFWLALALGLVTAVAGLAVTVGGFQSKRVGWFLLAVCSVPLLVFVAFNYERFFWLSFTGIVALSIAGAWPFARLRQAKTAPASAAYPAPVIKLKRPKRGSEHDDLISLEVENLGASAEFHAELTVHGVGDWPAGQSLVRWSNSKESRYRVARNAKGGIELAKLQPEGAAVKWIFFHWSPPPLWTPGVYAGPAGRLDFVLPGKGDPTSSLFTIGDWNTYPTIFVEGKLYSEPPMDEPLFFAILFRGDEVGPEVLCGNSALKALQELRIAGQTRLNAELAADVFPGGAAVRVTNRSPRASFSASCRVIKIQERVTNPHWPQTYALRWRSSGQPTLTLAQGASDSLLIAGILPDVDGHSITAHEAALEGWVEGAPAKVDRRRWSDGEPDGALTFVVEVTLSSDGATGIAAKAFEVYSKKWGGVGIREQSTPAGGETDEANRSDRATRPVQPATAAPLTEEQREWQLLNRGVKKLTDDYISAQRRQLVESLAAMGALPVAEVWPSSTSRATPQLDDRLALIHEQAELTSPEDKAKTPTLPDHRLNIILEAKAEIDPPALQVECTAAIYTPSAFYWVPGPNAAENGPVFVPDPSKQKQEKVLYEFGRKALPPGTRFTFTFYSVEPLRFRRAVVEVRR